MRTIRTMITTAGFPHDRNAQNLRRIKQRKRQCSIQVVSDDEDDQNDGKMSLAFPILFSNCQAVPRIENPLGAIEFPYDSY